MCSGRDFKNKMDNNYLFGTQFTLSENLFFLIIIEKLIVIGSYLMVGGGQWRLLGKALILTSFLIKG